MTRVLTAGDFAKLWYSEHDRWAMPGGAIWTTATARPIRELAHGESRCVRCGLTREVRNGRQVNPLCRECKGCLSTEQQEKWQ